MPASTAQPLTARLLTLAKHPQFAWWIGHCCVIFCASLYFFYWILLSGDSASGYYYWAYRGAVLSYAVVVYKQHGQPKLDMEYFRRINHDENVFYLALAFVWLYNPPILVTLIPYAIFSLFHLITYFRANIIPTFVPGAVPTAPDTTGSTKLLADLSKKIQIWVHKNHERAMQTVSFVEVTVITTTLLLHVLTFQIGFFVLVTYLLFLRIRFHMNHYTKDVFSRVGKQLDSWLLPPSADPRIPPYVTNVYRYAKGAVVWSGQLQADRQHIN